VLPYPICGFGCALLAGILNAVISLYSAWISDEKSMRFFSKSTAFARAIAVLSTAGYNAIANQKQCFQPAIAMLLAQASQQGIHLLYQKASPID